MKYIESADKSIIDYQSLSPFGKSYPRYYEGLLIRFDGRGVFMSFLSSEYERFTAKRALAFEVRYCRLLVSIYLFTNQTNFTEHQNSYSRLEVTFHCVTAATVYLSIYFIFSILFIGKV